VRRRAWIALGCVVGLIFFGILGQVLPGEDSWNLLAGLLLIVAAILGLTLLPIARRLMPSLVDFPDLFDRPRHNERWCANCGHPTGASGPCRLCGATPVSRAR